MVEVKPIDVCCSSEDPAFPALNLVRGALKPSDERKQWLCSSPDEKFAHVTLTYEKPFVISSLEIKNNGSAYVQVEGGSSEDPGRFKVLWRTQNLMTPSESRFGTETDGIYIFLPQDLATAEKDKVWDMIKITCSQPFNKLQKYGLSHVVARSALPIKEEIPSSPAQCSGDIPFSGVKREPIEDEVVNAARAHKATCNESSDPQNQMNSEVSSSGCTESSNPFTSPVTSPLISPEVSPVKQEAPSVEDIFYAVTPVRPEPSSSVHDAVHNTPHEPVHDSLQDSIHDSVHEPVHEPLHDPGHSTNQPIMQSPQVKQEPMHVNADSHSGGDVAQTVNASPLKRRISESDSHSDASSDDVQVIKRPAPSNIIYRPFNKLLDGVKISISGFENPYRSEIRSRALQLGATYCPTWTEMCTHLICAFLYTPKYRQAALDHGLIVTRDWIDQCFIQRKRLPWRRFALNPSDRSNEGGLEIWEAEPNDGAGSSSNSFSNNIGASNLQPNTDRPVESSPVRVICSNLAGPSRFQCRTPNVSLQPPQAPIIKREVLDRGECSSHHQTISHEAPSLEGIPRQLTIQGSCGPSPGRVISVKREIHPEETQEFWSVSHHVPSCAMNSNNGTEAAHQRRSHSSTSSPRHHLSHSVVSAVPGASGEQDGMRSAPPPNSAQMEPGPDGYAGYYRPISQPCAVPHSSPSATYLVPPVIMLPQTQYFVPVSQQFQAPPPSRDTYMTRTISSPQVPQHIRVIQHSNKTASEEESSKQN